MRIFYKTQRCPKLSNINLTFDSGLVFSHADPNVFNWCLSGFKFSMYSIISPANVKNYKQLVSLWILQSWCRLGLLDNNLLNVSCEHCGLQFFLNSVGWMHVDQDIPELV